MKKQDIFFGIGILIVLAPFFIFDSVYTIYQFLNAHYAIAIGFVKFAMLSTLGEVIALRIRKGVYYDSSFGVLPRMLVWGVLGAWIVIAMKVFGAGAPMLSDYILGTNGEITSAMKGSFSIYKLIGAFSISLLMNTSFAPVFMTLHKISDTHILNYEGRLSALVHPIPFSQILSQLNWKVQWNFVFKKTIPFFWIPAHTITFLLPSEFQVLFAALLGVALGIILAVAANK
ncbi:MAG: hypothetical protein RRX93_03345 [Bacteroidales bacterium]